MLNTNGIPPKLSGHLCDELLCQQYWYQGKLVDEVDVLFIKADGRWHELYFENGTIFWRAPGEMPAPFEEKKADPFSYPRIDLGENHGIKGKLIMDCETEPLLDGAEVIITLETGAVIITNVEGKTRIRYVMAA